MQLSNVSKTAFAMLRSHAIESERGRLIDDPMARVVLDRLAPLASAEERALLFERRLSPILTRHIALRARRYDAIADEYVARHPSCTVVNLGSGFDTRYFRIEHARCEYIDLDLPELIALKQVALGDSAPYEMLGCSVLDPSWIEKVAARRRRNVLLLAEGLFMYLPKNEVIALFRRIAEHFVDSRIAFEVVAERYTRGLWKKLVAWKLNRELGVDAGSSYRFGVKDAGEVEGYAEGLQVVDEWSFVEDPDLRPKILKYLGLERTQWTVTVDIRASR